MTQTTIQPGEGPLRDLVLVYFLTPDGGNGAGWAQACPGAMIVSDARTSAEHGAGHVGPGGIEPVQDLVARLQRRHDCQIRSVTLAGWSIGCTSVRAQLLHDPTLIDCVVAVDGTHASFPIPRPEHVDPWRLMLRTSEQGAGVFLATCSSLLYVERLPRPYMAARHVLERVTGIDPLDPGQDWRAYPIGANAGVWSYRYATAAGHVHQARAVLPTGLAWAMQRLHEVLRASDRLERPSPIQGLLPWQDPQRSYRERVVDWSLEQQDRLRERPPGSNSGADVAQILAPCVRDGRMLGLVQGNWCAAFACQADWRARMPHDPPAVHLYRASGVELQRDAAQHQAWHDRTTLQFGWWYPKPGDLAIYQRGSGPQDWRRHVVRVVSWEGETRGPLHLQSARFIGVGGNEQDTVRVGPRALGDPTLLGFIDIDGPDVPAMPTGDPALDHLVACVDDDPQDTEVA